MEMKEIDGYKIEKEIGKGGMGVVYKAVEPLLNRYVAIKIPNENSLKHKLFQKEALAIAGLNHPHILKLIEFKEHSVYKFYMVTDFVDGIDLKKWVKKKKRSIHEKLRVFTSIVRTVHYAHQKKIIHRDIKPSNIMMCHSHPIIMDFGIAKFLDAKASTKSGLSLGTTKYMPPEQMKNSKNVTYQSDIYALGTVLYEMLTGEVPFDSGTDGERFAKKMKEKVKFPKEIKKNIPKTVRDTTLKCLEIEPSNRFENCVELASELERFLERDLFETQGAKAASKNLFLQKMVMFFSFLSLLFLTFCLYLWTKRDDLKGQIKKEKSNNAFLIEKGKATKNKFENDKKVLTSDFVVKKRNLEKIWGQRFQQVFKKYELEKQKNRILSNKILSLEYKDIKVPLSDFFPMGKESFSCGGKNHNIKKFKHLKTGIEFVLLPSNVFGLRGRFVEIKAFLISRTEITQKVWSKFMKKNPSLMEGAKWPVTNVLFSQAQEFCRRTKLSLPNEAQWEYACRAGTTSKYFWGNDFFSKKRNVVILYEFCWAAGNSAGGIRPITIKRVKRKLPNAFGLHDMLGNAWEWCSDDFEPGEKLIRGGSFHSKDHEISCSLRNGQDISKSNFTIGFRVVFNLE